jgi:hypothetical protein
MGYLFEVQDCTRCNGTGRYSWCQMYGDRCFKCGGKKQILTKRGAAAQRFYNELSSVAAKDLKPGDIILDSGLTNGGQVFDYWAVVVSVESAVQNGSFTTTEGGVTKTVDMSTIPSVCITTTHPKYGESSTICAADSVRQHRNAEGKAERIKAALDYQATLTKLGKVAKRKARSPKTA